MKITLVLALVLLVGQAAAQTTLKWWEYKNIENETWLMKRRCVDKSRTVARRKGYCNVCVVIADHLTSNATNSVTRPYMDKWRKECSDMKHRLETAYPDVSMVYYPTDETLAPFSTLADVGSAAASGSCMTSAYNCGTATGGLVLTRCALCLMHCAGASADAAKQSWQTPAEGGLTLVRRIHFGRLVASGGAWAACAVKYAAAL